MESSDHYVCEMKEYWIIIFYMKQPVCVHILIPDLVQIESGIKRTVNGIRNEYHKNDSNPFFNKCGIQIPL